jgi:hypothetical protein
MESAWLSRVRRGGPPAAREAMGLRPPRRTARRHRRGLRELPALGGVSRAADVELTSGWCCGPSQSRDDAPRQRQDLCLGHARYDWLLAESHLTRRLFGDAPANLDPAGPDRLTVRCERITSAGGKHQSGEVSEKCGGTEPIPLDSRPGRSRLWDLGRWRVGDQRTADRRLERVQYSRVRGRQIGNPGLRRSGTEVGAGSGQLAAPAADRAQDRS